MLHSYSIIVSGTVLASFAASTHVSLKIKVHKTKVGSPEIKDSLLKTRKSSMAEWFLCNENEDIQGPFSSEEVKHEFAKGNATANSMVWGKVLEEWKSYEWWNSHLSQLQKKFKKKVDNRLWHYALHGESYGPVTRDSLIHNLKDLSGDANDALIWTKGMDSWAPIHEFHDLMEEIGVNRRQFPRAPIEGKVIIESDENTKLIGTLTLISEGGFGAENIKNLAAGMELKVEIQSPEFSNSIHTTAQVRYVNENGFVGFKYININREALSQIIGLVKEKNLQIIKEMKVA